MAKMKLDFKALLLNHAEKMGAGAIALLSVAGITTANWSACNLDPLALRGDADKTKSTWLAGSLPEDKKKELDNTPPVEKMAKSMLESIEETGKFATTRRWNDPLTRSRQKLESIIVMAPESPESSLVIFPLVEKNDEEEKKETEKEETPKKGRKKGKTETDNTDLANVFGPTTPTPGVGGNLPGGAPGGDIGSGLGDSGDGGLAGSGLAGSGMSSGKGGLSGGAGGLSGPPGMGSGPPGMGGMPGMPGMGGMGGMLGDATGGMGFGMGELDGYGGYGGNALGVIEKKKVRTHAGVSVRYVFNMYKQAQQIAEAMNLPGDQAIRLVDFVNLQIERKRAVPGADPWAGDWEPLPLDSVAEILKSSLAFDMEIVAQSVTRAEITMPLPRRATGRWTPQDASHKLLEDFQLSEEEQELINAYNEKLRKEAEKLKAQLPPDQAPSEGFRQYAFDSTDLMGGLNNAGFNGGDGMSGMMGDLYSSMRGSGNGQDGNAGDKTDDEKSKQEFEKQLRKAMAGGRLLLVRFMDFTCDRGAAYRYRVRLEMRNPHFNRPIDELVDPETASQKTVFSAWTDPTEPIFVPAGYRYYPEKVDSRPRAPEMASLTMYYEHETSGTPTMSTMKIPVGARIGGKQQIDIVDLGENTLEVKDVEVKSNDYLASVTEAPRLNRADFPELKDVFEELGGARLVGDRLTVVDSNGAILSRFGGDSVLNGEKLVSKDDDERLTKYVLETFAHLRPAKEGESNSPYEGAGGEDGGLGGASGIPGMGGSGTGPGSGMNFGGGMGRGSSLSGAGGRGGAPGRGGRGSGRAGGRGGMGADGGF